MSMLTTDPRLPRLTLSPESVQADGYDRHVPVSTSGSEVRLSLDPSALDRYHKMLVRITAYASAEAKGEAIPEITVEFSGPEAVSLGTRTLLPEEVLCIEVIDTVSSASALFRVFGL